MELQETIKLDAEKLNVIIFRSNIWFVAQCLEYNIAAQAKEIDNLLYEFQRLLIARIEVGKQLGTDPFKNIMDVPEAFNDRFKTSDATKDVKAEVYSFSYGNGEKKLYRINYRFVNNEDTKNLQKV